MKTRRNFLEFLGKSSVGILTIPAFLQSCGNSNNTIVTTRLPDPDLEHLYKFVIEGLAPSDKDDLVLAKGLKSEVLIRWNTAINEQEHFGFNNDFTCFTPLDGKTDDGLLWVNHEYVNPLFVSDANPRDKDLVRTIEQVDKELSSVGGSIIRVKKIDGKWTFVPNDPLNRRVDGKTKIAFNWDEPIAGKDHAFGTNSNCSGGVTPWGTILTCEENYDICWGETEYDEKGKASHRRGPLGYEDFYDYPSEHYGWVVEVDPLTGAAQKHIALGRCAHECCTLKHLDDGRVVAYTGDDSNDEFIYKFISSKPNSLKEGTLYAADTINGKWIPIDYQKQPLLQKQFKSQTEVLIRLREAARLLGATPQNRPEDIDIDPLTGDVVIACTNNTPKKDYYGTILKISETDGKYDALTFEIEAMATGGTETGFACPDNLLFDLAGNLWFTSDISSSVMNREGTPYTAFKNNGLFVLQRHGAQAGEIIQIASAPVDAELTGPWFSPDYKSLFLSVQHPGDRSRSMTELTSNWPHDEDGIPKPSVVVIEGELLDKLNRLDTVG